MEQVDELGLPDGPRPRLGLGARRAALASLLVLVAVIAWGLPISSGGPARATVALTDVPSSDGRMVQATVRISPPDALDGAHFANVTAWQGGGSVVSKLSEVRPGVYRTTKPVPVYGGWKTLLRVHTGNSLVGVPIYLPRDEAIPAREVPASAGFTRPFERDVKILQREQKEDVPGGLKLLAYLTVGTIAAGLIALIAWALLRLEGLEARRRRPRARSRTSAREAELV
jgi:hypothetical protein